ncbi:PD-(D/E)XK nuclease family transposase, partial [Parabacteroides caecihominis]
HRSGNALAARGASTCPDERKNCWNGFFFSGLFGSYYILQNCPQRYFFNRGFYYICRMISRQGQIGSDWKYGLLPVYGIYLLNFSLPEFHSWRTDVVLANAVTGETFGELKLKQVYISFELFNLEKEECVTPLEKLVFILKNMNIFDMAPFKEENEAFRRILDAANVNAMTPHERDVYDELLKRYRDWRCTTEYAIEQAEEKGLARGMEKGLEKGMEKGFAKGKAEEQREIAANFKKQGIGIETIALCTGLPIEEIERL